ncbi:MAG: hypothetical protein H7Y28_10470 [Rhodoferax sp.]|nr:hypothetical protein [Rhodoferax sp.]
MKFAVVLLALVLSGCTSRAWYDSFTSSTKADCDRLQPGAREDCLAKVNKTPYDTYEKERTKQNP